MNNIKNEYPVIVLGMHRSGSSAVTELLTSYGLHLGNSEDTLGKSIQNERGFWERKDARDLNDDILFSQYCDWDCISNFSCNNIIDSEREELVNRARNIHGYLSNNNSRSYVLKEPRQCLTHSIWDEAIKGNYLILYIFRDPNEVAKSLVKRNNMTMEHALSLWLNYNISALSSIGSKPVIFVSYNELSRDPIGKAQNIFKFLKHYKLNVEMPDDDRINEIIDPRLKHHNISNFNHEDCKYSSLHKYLMNLTKKDDFLYQHKLMDFLEVDSFDLAYEKELIFEKFTKCRSYAKDANTNMERLRKKIAN